MIIGYSKIREYLNAYDRTVITPAHLAFDLDLPSIPKAILNRLVNDKILEPCNERGFYWVIKNKKTEWIYKYRKD